MPRRREVTKVTKLRVLAVTPTYENQMQPRMRSAMEAVQRDGLDLTWEVINDNPHPPPDHRNVLHMYRRARERVLREGFDVLWTVEHDMIIPPDAALKLAATPGDVAYGVYLVRVGTYVLNAFEYVGDKFVGESLSIYPQKAEAARTAGVVRVSGAGWGCTWIRRKALEKIEFPVEWPENPSFDLSFAQQAIRAKLQLFANFGVLCGHIKDDQVLTPFDRPRTVDYNGAAWLIGGQLMPMYRDVEVRDAPAVQCGLKAVTSRAARAAQAAAGAQQAASAARVPVLALQTLNALVDGQSRRLVRGTEYQLPAQDAHELSRAGYVEVQDA